MTLHPPLSLQAAGTVENAVDWRHYIGAMAQALGGAGVIGSTALQCTVNNGTSSTPTTNVAVGGAIVAGTAAHQGSYFVYSDATVTVTHTTRDGSHARIDSIVAHVRDNAADPGDAGGNNDWVIVAVAGTPAASPVPPSLPDDCLLLGNVTVPTGSATTTIDDSVRVRLPAAFHVNKDLAVDGQATVTGNLTANGAIALGGGTIDGLRVNGVSILHDGLTASTDYALQQSSGGDTFINAKAGQAIHFREGNSGTDLFSVQDTGGTTDIEFSNGLPVTAGTHVVEYQSGTGKLSIQVSSRRYKHDELPLAVTHDPERIVRTVPAKTFVLDDDETETRRAGFIAEDVAPHFPQGVTYEEVAGEMVPAALQTNALVANLWGALQSAFAKIDRLEEQVSALKR